ncbi:MAG: hypothetical protein Q4C04_05940 [Clostridia bacterium]|nr:hypothetical protein [Clostridia bacterium]
MTTKELLYIEDALGHAQFYQSKFNETASQLQDPELRTLAEDMAKKHRQIFDSFYNLL